jgi:hypothetical protein
VGVFLYLANVAGKREIGYIRSFKGIDGAEDDIELTVAGLNHWRIEGSYNDPLVQSSMIQSISSHPNDQMMQ